MDADQIKRQYPLDSYLRQQNVPLSGSGNRLVSTKCPLLQHHKDHFCVEINPDKGLYHCHDCQQGGDVITWMATERSMSTVEFLKSWAEHDNPHRNGQVQNGKVQPAQIVATYDYTDEAGKLLYQVCRMEPKSFRQRQPNLDGWKWTMEGATRVLFRLPKVLTASILIICEGEKDVLALESLGYVATCNVGGAGKWLPAYSEFLRGKNIVVIPDNDKAGMTHADQVIDSLRMMATSLKRIHLPAPHKDSSDFITATPDAKDQIDKLIAAAPSAIPIIPVYSIEEMEIRYREFQREVTEKSLDLGKFLPSLGAKTRPLLPGDLMVVLADTGVGKTAIAQAISRAAAPMITLFFELELPEVLLFERFVQMEIGCEGAQVEAEYKGHNIPLWKNYKGLHHIFVCPESGLTTDQIESYVVKSELKIGSRPVLTIVDYIGLVRTQGKSRYEAMSYASEQMKIIAKRTGTIVVLLSQVARKQGKNKEDLEIHLHDARDSSSIEQSAGLVLGAWRPTKDQLMIKILKNTKGTSGALIECRFDGERMRIEQPPIQTELPV